MKVVYKDGEIPASEVLQHLALAGGAAAVFRGVIVKREAARRARELGCSVSNGELQGYADLFRRAHGLESAVETFAFLERLAMTQDAFEDYCETCVLAEKLVEHLSDSEKTNAHFIAHRAVYDRADISVIIVKEASLARELLMQMKEEGRDFHALARQHSLDGSSRLAGGFLGTVYRSDLEPGIAAKVFNASPGDILGPFTAEGFQQLVAVEAVHPADLSDPTVREQVRRDLYAAWASCVPAESVAIAP
jgi:parvulin-like peptidyl-prolyl isomerase